MKHIVKLTVIVLLVTNIQVNAGELTSSISKTEEIVNYANGSVRSRIPLENGIRQGMGYSYYPDGSKRAERSYINGKVSGVFRAWYKDGTLRGESEMKDGVRHGFYREYHQSGNKKEYVEYAQGEVIYMKLYHDDSSVLYEKNYEK